MCYRSVQPVDDVAFLHLSHIEENVFAHLDVFTEGQIRHEQPAAGALRPLDGEALRCGMLPQLVGGLRQTGKVQRPFQLRQLCFAVDIDQVILSLNQLICMVVSSLRSSISVYHIWRGLSPPIASVYPTGRSEAGGICVPRRRSVICVPRAYRLYAACEPCAYHLRIICVSPKYRLRVTFSHMSAVRALPPHA